MLKNCNKLFATVGLILLMMGTSESLNAQVYAFSPKHFKQSFNCEVGLTFFSDFIRSPMFGQVYPIQGNTAYPEPFYMWSYSLFTASIEPQFRLLEMGSAQSISLNTPVALAGSFLDLQAKSGTLYSPEPPTSDDLLNGEYYHQRDYSILGYGHAEIGALLSYNLGVNSTAENTWGAGFNLAFGYNYIYGPLFFNTENSVSRSDYAPYMRWGHWVGRFGIQGRRVGVNYMLGLNQKQILYTQPGTTYQTSLETSVYHRMAMTIKISK